jgi:DNA-binding YbaB/EbfC family protein
MKARLPQGFGGGGANNMQSMMKQAQKMQEDMAKIQQELEEKEFSVSVGGGVVEAVMSGKKVLKTLNIKPEVVDPEDIEMLQDLVISAINEAIKKVEDHSENEMGKVTGGMNMPGLF